MGDGTKIEWADATLNPIVGCSRISPGCDACYAIGVVHRGMSEQHVGLTVKPKGERVDWTGEARVVESMLDKPLRWKRPRRIFVNSLSDLFHENVSVETIGRIFAMMALASQHTFQILTKRSKRMMTVMSDPDMKDRVWDLARGQFRQDMHGVHPAWRRVHEANPWLNLLAHRDEMPWPLPNVHLGVSIENDQYTFRADHLRATPAAVRWISAEPLLGALPSLDLTDISWVVCGGESGPGARPMHPDWARDLRDRCIDMCNHVGHWPGGEVGIGRHDGDDAGEPCDRPAFLFKQWGSWAPWVDEDWSEPRGTTCVKLDGSTSWRAGDDDHLTNWSANYEPTDHGVTKVPKHVAGRLLDGREWNEYPA